MKTRHPFLLPVALACATLLFPTLASSTPPAPEALAAASAERWSNLPGLDPAPVEVRLEANGDEYLLRDMADVIDAFRLDSDLPGHTAIADRARVVEFLSRPHPSVATVDSMLLEASREFDVPVELLRAIAQVESNWTHVGPMVDQGWGILHLVRNGYVDTLGAAADLLGVTTERIQDDPRTNIRAGAALLRSFHDATTASLTERRAATRRDALESWFEPSKSFSALFSDELRQLQAETYFETLSNGVDSPTLWGERVVLPPTPGVDLEALRGLAVPSPKSFKTADYAPAQAYFMNCNFGWGRSGSSVDTWVNHWVGNTGSWAANISSFQSCNTGTSAHFIIRASDGAIAQLVGVDNTAWHAGYLPTNRRSIGVEHEADPTRPGNWNSNAMLQASADMASYFADLYGIPRVRALPGIRGHSDIVGTACPGNLPWTDWMNRFNGSGGSGGGSYDAQILEGQSSIPGSINPGQILPVTLRVQNTGTATWRASDLVRLASDPDGQNESGFRWRDFQCLGYSGGPGDNRAELCHDVAPGATHDFRFSIEYPDGAFTANVDLAVRMVRDGVGFFGEHQGLLLNVVGGYCSCGGGTSFWGQTIPTSDTWCGFRVCGLDNQLYQCNGGWSGTGSYGCSSCQCTGGWDYLGNSVDPDYTYCGFEVCGSDHHMYRCTGATSNGGWTRLTTTCP